MKPALFMIAALAVLSPAAQAQTPNTMRLSLGDAARMAAAQNGKVVEAKYRADAARARVSVQRSALLPQISAGFAKTSHTLNTATFGLDFPSPPGEPPLLDPAGEVIGPVRLTDVRGRLRQTLFDWSTFTRVKGASAAVDAAVASTKAAAQQAGTAASKSYVQAFGAEQNLANRRSDVALAKELVEIARQQLASGTGVKLDVTRAEAQLATANAHLVTAQVAAQRTKLALVRALGLSPNTSVALTDSLPSDGTATTPTPEQAIEIALSNRADLRVMDSQIKTAELQVTAIRASRLPTVNLIGDNGWIGNSSDNLLHTYNFGLEVSMPLFQGFRTNAQAQEQRAQVGELEARRRDLKDQVEFEVRSALLEVTGAVDQVAAAGHRLRVAEQEVAAARERYEAGVAGSADVVTASMRLDEARTAYTEAQVAYQTARVSLAAAEGNVTELP